MVESSKETLLRITNINMTQNISDQQRIAALSAALASLTFALETVANLANLPAQSTEELYKYVSYGKAVIEKHAKQNI